MRKKTIKHSFSRNFQPQVSNQADVLLHNQQTFVLKCNSFNKHGIVSVTIERIFCKASFSQMFHKTMLGVSLTVSWSFSKKFKKLILLFQSFEVETRKAKEIIMWQPASEIIWITALYLVTCTCSGGSCLGTNCLKQQLS